MHNLAVLKSGCWSCVAITRAGNEQNCADSHDIAQHEVAAALTLWAFMTASMRYLRYHEGIVLFADLGLIFASVQLCAVKPSKFLRPAYVTV